MQQYFASLTLAELTPIYAIMAGMLTGFYAIAKIMISQSTKERDDDRAERKAFADVIREMADSNRQIAKETKDGNRKAEIRNGHLGEQNVQIAELIKSTREDMLDAVQNVKIQHVERQEVNTEIVKSKE